MLTIAEAARRRSSVSQTLKPAATKTPTAVAPNAKRLLLSLPFREHLSTVSLILGECGVNPVRFRCRG